MSDRLHVAKYEPTYFEYKLRMIDRLRASKYETITMRDVLKIFTKFPNIACKTACTQVSVHSSNVHH